MYSDLVLGGKLPAPRVETPAQPASGTLTASKREWVRLEHGVFLAQATREAGEARTRGGSRLIATADTVTIDYTGKLRPSLQQFDSSRARGKPVSFTVGVGQVVPGLDIALKHMAEGDRVVVWIPAKMGYGSRGAGGRLVPPNQDLEFDIQVHKVLAGPPKQQTGNIARGTNGDAEELGVSGSVLDGRTEGSQDLLLLGGVGMAFIGFAWGLWKQASPDHSTKHIL